MYKRQAVQALNLFGAEHCVGDRAEQDFTGKVRGVFDVNFDKREFSAVHIIDGWQTWACLLYTSARNWWMQKFMI